MEPRNPLIDVPPDRWPELLGYLLGAIVTHGTITTDTWNRAIERYST